MKSLRCVLLGASLSVFVSLANAQVRVATTETGSNLVWSDGATIRETSATVADLRSFAVPGSAARVATWRERDSSGVTPYYAISLDGAHVAAVKATNYDLLLRRAQFDPVFDPPSFADSALASGGNVYIVQYVTQPLIEYSDTITALGGRVYDYIANHAHLVRMSGETRGRISALPFVRWIGEYHPEFRVDPDVLASLHAQSLATERYNVQVFERGLEQQDRVAARIAELGGIVHLVVPEGFRMEATLSPEQLATVASMDEVRFVDRWSAPEDDMDIARQISGANYVEATPGNYTGQGVNVEVLDGGADLAHPDLVNHVSHGNVPVDSHGTCTSGIVCGSGAGNAQARGVMPSARLVAGYYNGYSGGNRYVHTAQLVDPSLSWQCVLQSNSWGSTQTSSYTTISAEMDDIVVIDDFLICQSQSNTGSTNSRPQAWAKNVLSVGGIRHHDTLSTSDDNWQGASIGPAADGRLKPDLSHFYDLTLTTDVQGGGGYDPGNYTPDFGGTSGATPITAGYCGLFFQMWHDGIFGNTPVGATVFAGRPHFTLAKAAMVNTASQYTFSGTSHNLTRTHQGWGLANVQTLYDQRAKTFFVDQTDVVSNLSSVSYSLDVAPGEPALRVTLVYRDAMGAVASTQHRKNDLTLKVTSPGNTIYFGNNGLAAGNWSTSGGNSNTKDTVENVFVQNPAAGTWTVYVLGDDVNTNPSTNAPASTTDFALWATGVTFAGSCTTPVTYCFPKVTSAFTVPTIGSNGSPSLGAGSFAVTLTQALPNKNGILFYGSTQAAAPFQGGFLCVLPPTVRMPVLTTDSSSSAVQPIAIDASMVSTTRYYQWWFRDPQDANTTGLSAGLIVTFCD
jgi:hypothetical protein